MSESVRGSCVCGGVSFEIDRPFKGFQYCHCGRCRKKSGSAHVANVFVPVDQFRWLSGQDSVRRFELPDAKYWCSGFCTVCGCSMPWISRTGKAMVVPAGAFDGDPGERPRRNIYFGSRPAWYVHASELETFEGGPKG